jgi:hypothetical protein
MNAETEGRDDSSGDRQELRIFIYSPEVEPKTVMVGGHLSVAELAAMAGVPLADDDWAFPEPFDRDDFDVTDFDAQEPVARETRLDQLARGARVVHLAIHPCRHVLVTIQYQSRTIDRRFSPARTVSGVRRWALRKLNLNDAATDKLILQICGSTRRPGPDARLGSIIGRSCAMCFDLVPDQVVEG